MVECWWHSTIPVSGKRYVKTDLCLKVQDKGLDHTIIHIRHRIGKTGGITDPEVTASAYRGALPPRRIVGRTSLELGKTWVPGMDETVTALDVILARKAKQEA